MKNKSEIKRERTRTLGVIALAFIISGFLIVSGDVTMNASATDGNSELLDPLVDLAVPLIVIGVLIAMVAVLFYVAKQKQIAIFGGVVAGIFIVTGLGGVLIGAFLIESDGTKCASDEYWNGSQCVKIGNGVYVANWDCDFVALAAGGPGGAHDAVTEFPDTPFVAADGGTPDLNKVIMVPVIDYVQGRAIVDVAVDDDATPTNTVYLATDAYAFDVRCKLLNPLPAVAGGNVEVPIWGQMSWTYTAGTNNNGSFAGVLYCDQQAGYYAGFGTIADSGATADLHDADHTYVSYTNSLNCPAAPPLTGGWVPLGTSDGDSDGEWISPWLVLNSGLSDYSSPPVGTTDTATVRLGTSPDQTQWKGNVVTLAIDLRISVRT